VGDVMNSKIRWLRERMNGLNLQGMIISNPKNIRYLTNVEAEGVVLITRKENIIITDGRYIEHVHNTLTIDDEMVVMDRKDISLDEYENFFSYCENVGFEEAYVTYAEYKQIMHRYKINNLEETDGIIEKQRMIKDQLEITRIGRACQITDACFEYLKEFIQIGMSEKQIAFEIQKFFLENGADGLAFDTIVASGEHASMPHAIPTDRKIKDGDAIIIDMGCTYKGYCSDMTRTVFAGHIPERVKPVYDLVLKNQLQTAEDMKEGASIRTIAKMVEGDFKLAGHDFVHSLGHGVGLDIHEVPNLTTRNDNTLKANMIVTNEPGIYIPGDFGVRIEDTVQITKFGSINLTKSDKNYTIVAWKM